MNGLSAAGMLQLFEEGERGTPLARTALVAPLALTAGELETRLLELRAATFGTLLEGVAACPACGEHCEVTLRTSDILALPASRDPVHAAGFEVRLPTGEDIAAVMHLDDPRPALLERCAGAPVPTECTDEIEDALAAADPRADVQIALTCPACAHAWLLRFDAIAFLWSDVAAGAERVLADVDTLARAFGWNETEILAMSARRRALYVERARS